MFNAEAELLSKALYYKSEGVEDILKLYIDSNQCIFYQPLRRKVITSLFILTADFDGGTPHQRAGGQTCEHHGSSHLVHVYFLLRPSVITKEKQENEGSFSEPPLPLHSHTLRKETFSYSWIFFVYALFKYIF